jgi:Zn-dependent metalloprotease
MARSPIKESENFLLRQDKTANLLINKSTYPQPSVNAYRKWFMFLSVIVTVITCVMTSVQAQMEEGDDPGAQKIHGFPGQAVLSPSAVSSFKRLTEEHGGAWRVHWNDKTGRVRSMFGDKTRPYPGDAKAAAIRFLEDYESLFFVEEVAKKQDPPNLAATRARKTLAGTVVTFQQTVRGLKVVDGFVDILVSEEGCIKNVTSTAANITDIDPSPPTLTGNEAFAFLKQTLEKYQPITLLQSPELVIWSKASTVLVYDIRVSQKESWNVWRHYVDANTGDILESQRLVADKKPRKNRETDPTGKNTEAGTVLLKEGIKQSVPGVHPPNEDENQKEVPVESSMEEITPANRSAGDYGQTTQANDKRRTIQ